MDDVFLAREHSAYAVSPLKDIDWHKANPESHTQEPLKVASGNGGKKGPASLKELAARVAAKHIDDIDHLDQLSPRTVRLLWGQVCGYQPISLNAWKAANKSLLNVTREECRRCSSTTPPCFFPKCTSRRRGRSSDQTQEAFDSGPCERNYMLKSFVQHIMVPTADLAVYLKPLTPTKGFSAFITQIRIAGVCQIKSTELILLSGLQNLGSLELVEPVDPEMPFPRVSDRLVREWSRQENPFPKLLVLRILTHYSLTENSLQYFTSFPALAVLEVAAANKDWLMSKQLAESLGWSQHGGWHAAGFVLQTLEKGPPYMWSRQTKREIVREFTSWRTASPWPVVKLVLGLDSDSECYYQRLPISNMEFFRARASSRGRDGVKDAEASSSSKQDPVPSPDSATQPDSSRATKRRRTTQDVSALLEGFQN